MKAMMYTTYGSPAVLHLQEVAKLAPKTQRDFNPRSRHAGEFWRPERAQVRPNFAARFCHALVIMADGAPHLWGEPPQKTDFGE